jgi:putative membrane protein
MIPRYSDHAANERTFLAWVRTAIAIMAFGFVVAKFNLFLHIAAESLGGQGHPISLPGTGFGNVAGIALILAGTAIIAIAAVRFVRTRQAIDSPEQRQDAAGFDLLLAGLMVLLGLALVFYLSHTI